MNKKSIPEVIGAFRHTQLLLTAARLKIFSNVYHQPQGSEELAETLLSEPRGIRILCDALVAQGYLEKRADNKYHCPNESFETFVEGGEFSREETCLFSINQYQRWGKLYDSIKIDTVDVNKEEPEEVDVTKQTFGKALDRGAKVSAKQTADLINLTKEKSMLDVGGGSGRYIEAFGKRYPNLALSILDHPDMLTVAKTNIEAVGLSSRVKFFSGDMFEYEFEQKFDFILLSNVIHMFSIEENIKLFKRIGTWLNQGGLIVVKDFKLEENRSEPLDSAMFAMHMYLYNSGDCYTLSQVKHLFKAANVSFERACDVGKSSALILARS